jgi:hypothetical protein
LVGYIGIALITYTLPLNHHEFWDCGEYIATAAKLKLDILQAFISNDWRFFCDVCFRQSTYCLNGKYDFCFSSALPFYFVLVFFMILKKTSFKNFSSVKEIRQIKLARAMPLSFWVVLLLVLWPILIQTVLV